MRDRVQAFRSAVLVLDVEGVPALMRHNDVIASVVQRERAKRSYRPPPCTESPAPTPVAPAPASERVADPSPSR